MESQPRLPFKSVAGSLLFSVFLGPIGLLYASTFGGVLMFLIAFAVVCTRLPVPIFIVWAITCMWSVIATNRYNKKIIRE